MDNITEEELDKFIADTEPEIDKQGSGEGAIIVAWLVLAAKELKGKRVGKSPTYPVPGRYLDHMIKDNNGLNKKGSKEIFKIATELRKINNGG